MNMLTVGNNRLYLAGIVVLLVAVLATAYFWPRTNALQTALQPLVEQSESGQISVAKSLADNYKETRTSAKKWSGIYWGFTFAAALLSALAALILKVESIFSNNDGLKKDLAATFSVCAALLITISTSGDFQRKWQANRIAASELERLGYELLNDRNRVSDSYFQAIGDILHRKNIAIVGQLEEETDGRGSQRTINTGH